MFLMNDQHKTGRVARVPHLSRLLWHDLVQGDGDDGRDEEAERRREGHDAGALSVASWSARWLRPYTETAQKGERAVSDAQDGVIGPITDDA